MQAATVLHILQDQQALVARLEALLREEQALLARPESSGAADLVERKRDCLAQLDRGTAEWEAAVRRDSADRHDLASFSAYLAGLPPAARHGLDQAWASLRQGLEACRRLNLANGRVIAITSRNLERNLRLLKGQGPTTELYTADGRASGIAAYQRGQLA